MLKCSVSVLLGECDKGGHFCTVREDGFHQLTFLRCSLSSIRVEVSFSEVNCFSSFWLCNGQKFGENVSVYFDCPLFIWCFTTSFSPAFLNSDNACLAIR